MAQTVTVDLPTTFYDDHEARDLPSGQLVKRLARKVRVELDGPTWDEIMSDARYYADTAMGWDRELIGLCRSAEATVRALEKVGRPD